MCLEKRLVEKFRNMSKKITKKLKKNLGKRPQNLVKRLEKGPKYLKTGFQENLEKRPQENQEKSGKKAPQKCFPPNSIPMGPNTYVLYKYLQ